MMEEDIKIILTRIEMKQKALLDNLYGDRAYGREGDIPEIQSKLTTLNGHVGANSKNITKNDKRIAILEVVWKAGLSVGGTGTVGAVILKLMGVY